MMVVRLRKYAIDKAIEIAQSSNIDPETKAVLLETVKETAIRPRQYGRLVYRMIAVGLGLVALLVVVLAFVLVLQNGDAPAAFYTLGSAAIGALGGALAPHALGGQSDETTSSG